MTHIAHETDTGSTIEEPRKHHVCPWWIGYLLALPIRRLRENPEKILAPLVEPGMTVVDIGCAMGFFSLPLAKMVGTEGCVYCLDVQERMLRTLERRARRRGLDGVVRTRECTQEDLGIGGLRGAADLVLAVHVVHETTYPRSFLTQCRDTLREGGKLLLIEPSGHVSEAEFEETRQLAFSIGFAECSFATGKRSRRLVLEKH